MYEIDYNRQEFKDVNAEKNAAIKEMENTYNGIANNSDKYFQAQINASKQWANTQKQNQQAQTDFAIEQIEQQKDQAHKDYVKEQSGAYTDWQKQSNQYGANAEQMAAQGMAGSGFSESSQVSMYNTYQNRVATAREAYSRAVLNYDNAIKDARLQNNSVLAEIAYNALQQQLELSLQGFQYKNNLLLEKADKKTQLSQIYHERYQDVLNQINTENALAEDVRQYNTSMAEQRRQHNETLAEQKRQFNAEMSFKNAQFAWQKEQAAKSSSGGSSGGTIKKGRKSSKGSTSSKGGSTGASISSKSGSPKISSSSKPTVDLGSVLDLGLGPISPGKLNELVKSGKVKETEKNGKLVYSKAGKLNLRY